jgi:16S rRNA (guanine966-N2)-methyltransferase
VRVIGGEWRGRPLVAPRGRGTRPTSDKVREAIFSVLAALPEVCARAASAPAAGAPAEDPAGVSHEAPGGRPAGVLAGQHALDLFAGSGALGIEALSRGAVSCAFVENERAALAALRGNLARLGVEAGASPAVRVVASDVRRALQADARRGARYTLVFADPPYDRYAEVRPALVRLLEPLLATRAVLVIETAAGTEAELPWTTVRVKRYGDTHVTFLVTGDERTAGGPTGENDAETG